jgi:hypothetical protein
MILGDVDAGWTSSDTPMQGCRSLFHMRSHPQPHSDAALLYQIVLSTLIPQDLTT